MSLFNFGKARAPHRKTTASMPPVRIAPPETVTILMTQHIGAAATPTVKVGDSVFVGTLVGAANGYVSANIHSSVSGTVKKLDYFLLPSGETTQSVIIESDGNMTPDPSLTPHTVTSFSELSDAARECGLVGLGGAGFPTSVKLNPEKIDKIDTLLLNGAECEPYITSDTRTMLDEADLIREGVLKITELSDIKRVVIGIEKNKPECIEKLREVFASEDFVEIRPLPSLYPQGAEKILIYNSLGRIIPEGKLPADIGVLVMNVTTVATLAKYLKTGMPLVEKCLTVDGSAIKSPANVIVPVGTPISHVIDAVGGFSEEPGKILFGGPMMGVAVYSLDAPILKNNNAIIALGRKEYKSPKGSACIHCGRCATFCPVGLNPPIFLHAMGLADSIDRGERLEAAKVNLCIECGTCSFVCPAKRSLLEQNRLGKAQLKKYKQEIAKFKDGGSKQ